MDKIQGQIGIAGMDDNGAAEYAAFVEKFEPKLTTDDCYTPEPVYDAVLKFVCRHYGLQPAQTVRPFWPGGDYETFDYPEDCVVVDNPPFSILTDIQRFYMRRKIRFFLFAPGLSVITADAGVTAIVTDVKIIYHNGATVPTAFRTNLSPEICVQTMPELDHTLNAVIRKMREATTRTLPKYRYPENLLHIAFFKRLACQKIPFALQAADAQFVRALDAQRVDRKSIFGGGFLVSAAAAAAAADNTIVYQLSDRERAIVRALGETENAK